MSTAIRLQAEEAYAEELKALQTADDRPRPTNWVDWVRGDALGLASLRTSRASSGLTCVEVRLKEIYDHISFTL